MSGCRKIDTIDGSDASLPRECMLLLFCLTRRRSSGCRETADGTLPATLSNNRSEKLVNFLLGLGVGFHCFPCCRFAVLCAACCQHFAMLYKRVKEKTKDCRVKEWECKAKQLETPYRCPDGCRLAFLPTLPFRWKGSNYDGRNKSKAIRWADESERKQCAKELWLRSFSFYFPPIKVSTISFV